ncbi:MAG TPA: HEAT repeat domain-containing protein [Candidatus Limnocylindrales bacterium]
MALFGPPDVEQLKVRRDVQGLIRALGYAADASVRRAAVAALGELGDARAVDPLILAMRNPDWQHDWHDTAALTEALTRLGTPSVGPLIATLTWHSNVVRVSAAGALAAIGRPAVQPLIALLGNADLETREAAGQILAEIGADALDQLIEALNGEVSSRRQWAARILGEIDDPRAVEPLLRALTDELAGVRQTAARSLGTIADLRTADALVSILDDPSGDVRRSAALALAEMRDPRAVHTLLTELLRAKDKEIVNALVKVGFPVVEPLLAMLADAKARGGEPWVFEDFRSGAPAILIRIGCRQDVAKLVAQLFVEGQEARSDAASQLFLLYSSGELDAQTKAVVLAARPHVERARSDGLPEDYGRSDL